MLNTTESWNTFYESHPHMQPSTFSYWVLGNLYQTFSRKLASDETNPYYKDKFKLANLVDVGCGNGRDSLLFTNHMHDLDIRSLTCLDSSSEAIEATKVNLNAFSREKHAVEHCSFVVEDVCKFDFSSTDVCYCRFFLHAISEDDFHAFLGSLNHGTTFFAETRVLESSFDILGNKVVPGVYEYENHKRRILTVDVLLAELEKYMFICQTETGTYSSSSTIIEGRKDNPNLLRVYGIVK